MTERMDQILARIDHAELSTLWHLSRTATATAALHSGRYARFRWASRAYARAHPDVSPTAAYKALDRMLAAGGR